MRSGRALAFASGAVLALLVVLAIPGPAPRVAAAPPGGRAFAWNQDSVWDALEAAFVRARVAGCADSGPRLAASRTLRNTLDRVGRWPLSPAAPVLDTLESRFFTLAPQVAACPAGVDSYLGLYARMREVIKRQSREWDVNAPAARDRLYRSLYGGRAAVEEVMLQHPERIAELLRGGDEPSAAPAAVAHGVELRSGDILVSRGGYPTSALIARGNDYPGNFSHIGLVHVDERTHQISVVEAHIERGMAIATFVEYLADKKLRLMLLRLRADLPAVRRDPLLPHRAATAALNRARAGHVPYDFTMDYTDPSRVFCSEVASSVYHDLGVDLWLSFIRDDRGDTTDPNFDITQAGFDGHGNPFIKVKGKAGGTTSEEACNPAYGEEKIRSHYQSIWWRGAQAGRGGHIHGDQGRYSHIYALRCRGSP